MRLGAGVRPGARRGRRQPGARAASREQGAAVVEMVLVLPVLIAVLMATVAFGMAAVAKAVVTNAARDSARLAAIECGQGVASWWADAEAAARSALGGGLRVTALSATPDAYGEWSFQATCSDPGVPGGTAAVALTYDEVDLFPPLGALLGGRQAVGLPGAQGRVFRLEAGAEFPEE